ncbi:hypothetical protein L209DRAFT_754069 [Thermothelomyces heterothallicus CBS 203.75]
MSLKALPDLAISTEAVASIFGKGMALEPELRNTSSRAHLQSRIAVSLYPDIPPSWYLGVHGAAWDTWLSFRGKRGARQSRFSLSLPSNLVRDSVACSWMSPSRAVHSGVRSHPSCDAVRLLACSPPSRYDASERGCFPWFESFPGALVSGGHFQPVTSRGRY